MNIKIKRVDTDLPLPKYETKGAAGFDFLARESKAVQPKEIVLVPGNIIVETPAGYMLVVTSRSSTPKKKGVMLPHGIGIIDSDYRGPDDEIWIQVYNFTDSEIVIERGEKIAQGIFVPVVQAKWEEVTELSGVTRGGRGSTGGYSHEIDSQVSLEKEKMP